MTSSDKSLSILAICVAAWFIGCEIANAVVASQAIQSGYEQNVIESRVVWVKASRE